MKLELWGKRFQMIAGIPELAFTPFLEPIRSTKREKAFWKTAFSIPVGEAVVSPAAANTSHGDIEIDLQAEANIETWYEMFRIPFLSRSSYGASRYEASDMESASDSRTGIFSCEALLQIHELNNACSSGQPCSHSQIKALESMDAGSRDKMTRGVRS